jgi:hypothetical protein
MDKFRDGVKKLRIANLVHKATADRIRQVRLGSIFPIFATASALLAYVCLPPLVYGSFAPIYGEALEGIAYVLACTSIGLNIAFGLWLLLPAGAVRTADLVYRGY